MSDLLEVIEFQGQQWVRMDVVREREREIERLRGIIHAYATIGAARRIGRMPPEKCLDCVRDFHDREAAKAGGDDE